MVDSSNPICSLLHKFVYQLIRINYVCNIVVGESLSEPHIDCTCVHLRYMYVGGGGGSMYVPPFTIADYKYIPYTVGTL